MAKSDASSPEQSPASPEAKLKPVAKVKPKSVPVAQEKPVAKLSRREKLNGIPVERFYSGTDRICLGDFLYRLIVIAQRTGSRRNPDNPNEMLIQRNAPALEPIRQWLVEDAPEDFLIEHQAAFIGMEFAERGEATIENVAAAALVPIPLAGLQETGVVDLRQRSPDDMQVTFGDPGLLAG